LNPHVLSDTRT